MTFFIKLYTTLQALRGARQARILREEIYNRGRSKDNLR